MQETLESYSIIPYWHLNHFTEPVYVPTFSNGLSTICSVLQRRTRTREISFLYLRLLVRSLTWKCTEWNGIRVPQRRVQRAYALPLPGSRKTASTFKPTYVEHVPLEVVLFYSVLSVSPMTLVQLQHPLQDGRPFERCIRSPRSLKDLLNTPTCVTTRAFATYHENEMESMYILQLQ